MNLEKKKILASKVLKAGKERIVFLPARIDEIKEAITRQDIKDLYKDGAIIIKNIKGKRKKEKVKSRSVGNVRKKVNKRKKNYVMLTRKLRKYAKELVSQGKATKEEMEKIRKKIKNKDFRSKKHLKEHVGGTSK